MIKDQKEEIDNLDKRGNFKIILKEEFPENIIPGRFVLNLKSTIDRKIGHKGRFSIGAHRDQLKYIMVNPYQIYQSLSIYLLLVLEKMF